MSKNIVNEDETEIQKTYIHNINMTKEERYFWGTIIILIVFTVIIMVVAWVNNKEIFIDNNITKKSIYETYVLNEEIEKNKSQINVSLKAKQIELEKEIENDIDRLFAPVYNNVDTFLDFHYSVIGEYTELSAAATNNFTEMIEQKLFGEVFKQNHTDTLNAIETKLKTLEIEHGKEVEELITKDVDKDINKEVMDKLKKDSLYRLGGTLVTVGGIKTASKVLLGKMSIKLASKLTSKFGTKLFIKTVAKTGTKTGAAGTAAAVGLGCGPFAIICSPALAIGAWFTADAIVSSVDEVFTRDDFEKELIQKIDEMKKHMLLELQKPFIDELANFSKKIVKDYGTVEVKKHVEDIIYSNKE